MFEEIEYVDPEKDKCAECGCGFGVHLLVCSKFAKKCICNAPREYGGSNGMLCANCGGKLQNISSDLPCVECDPKTKQRCRLNPDHQGDHLGRSARWSRRDEIE